MSFMTITSPTQLTLEHKIYPCATGKGGIVSHKTEGDGATPQGQFPLREVYFRPDRLSKPETALTTIPLSPDMGWCDDPDHPFYNQRINRPFSARHEELWREDPVYDVIVVVGYNDDPIIPSKGSAIFLHLARNNYEPTAGCIALSLSHMVEVLRTITPETKLVIPSCEFLNKFISIHNPLIS